MSEKRKIILIIPNFGLGGAQRSFSKLVRWLSEKYEVTVVVFDKAFENLYPHNTEVRLLGNVSPKNLAGKTFNFFKRKKRLNKIKKEIHPDISISFLEGADYLNLTSGAEKKIVSIRGSKQYDPHIKGIQGWIRKKILILRFYKKADVIVTVSKGLEYEIKTNYPSLQKKITTIPNGFELKNSSSIKSGGEKYFLLAWMGRFSDEKGLSELLEIFKQLRFSDGSFRLLLIGEGALKNEIRKFAADNHFRLIEQEDFSVTAFPETDIILHQTKNDPSSILSQTDLFLLTSPSEGFPNVIVEAMIAGIPVVSTDCPWGPREVLQSGLSYEKNIDYPFYAEAGILMPVFKSKNRDKIIEMWVTVITELRKNTSLLQQYRIRGIERCREYDEELIKQSWYNLIEGLVA